MRTSKRTIIEVFKDDGVEIQFENGARIIHDPNMGLPGKFYLVAPTPVGEASVEVGSHGGGIALQIEEGKLLAFSMESEDYEELPWNEEVPGTTLLIARK